MAASRLFYFSSGARQVYLVAGGGLRLEASFPADDFVSAIESFRSYLRDARGSHFSFVVDVAGEDFQEEQIPHLRGGDRETVIERRLAQRFREARLSTALSLGMTGDERRNERLLLASFASSEALTPWMEEVTSAGITLAGVYTVPLLAPPLAKALGARGGHALVVSLDQAGLRQSFIEDGKLRFARLERTADLPADALPALVRSETARLVQYLQTLRLLPKDGAPVQVFAIAPAGQRAAFEDVLVSDSRLAFHTVGIEEAAKKIGLRQLAREAEGEQLYLHLAARKPPRDQFARGEDRRAFFLWQLQRGIAAAGALAFVVCAGYAGTTWLNVMDVRGQATVQAREAHAANAEYQRITSGFPVTQTTTDNLRATVTEFRSIAIRTAWPHADFAHVSRVLAKFPQLDLERLEWRVERERTLSAEKPAAQAAPAPAPAGAQKPAAESDGDEHARVIQISGRVNATQRSDYRGITGQVQEFAQALRGGTAYRILRTQLPFDVTPDSTLSGDIGETESGEAPRFVISIARRVR